MKAFMRKYIALVILFGAAAGMAAADETMEVWTRLYKSASSLSEKYAIMQNVVQLNDRTSVQLETSALQQLIIDDPSIKGATDRDTYHQLLRLLLGSLGSFKAVEAAPFAWQVVDSGDDPLVRAEALIALGKMRATDYVERIGLMLKSLNLGPGANPENSEKLAYGCIVSLGKMRDVRGYGPVFFASVGWYSRHMITLAEDTLANLADDPTDVLTEIVNSETYPLKLRALEFEAKSKAAPDRKASLAIAALGVGQRAQSNDVKENVILSQIRTEAMNLLVAAESHDPGAVDLLRYAANNGLDINEKVVAVYALGTNGTDDAVTALSDLLMGLSDLHRVGKVNNDNDRLAMAAVLALGRTKKIAAKPALLDVEFAGWPGSVVRASKEALATLR